MKWKSNIVNCGICPVVRRVTKKVKIKTQNEKIVGIIESLEFQWSVPAIELCLCRLLECLVFGGYTKIRIAHFLYYILIT